MLNLSPKILIKFDLLLSLKSTFSIYFIYRITSIKRPGRYKIFHFKGGGGGGVYKILAIFFSHKVKKAYKILKSSQYF